MLKLIIIGEELFNEITEEFETRGDVVLELEHSLLSLSKWESKYKKPFLGNETKSPEEIGDYVKMMILSEDYPSDILERFSRENWKQVNDYISSSESATTFSDVGQTGPSREVITSELIYYWMVALTVPFECENWHLNRLFALLRIANIKQSPEKKMSKSEIAARNRALNDQRKRELGTRG